MAITAVGTPTTTNNGNATVSNTTGLNIPWTKTGLQAGDVILMHVNFGISAGPEGPNLPTGGAGTWVQVAKVNHSTQTLTGAVYAYRILQADLDNTGLTQFNIIPFSTAIDMQAGLQFFRGVDSTTLLSGTTTTREDTVANTGVSANSMTTADAGAMVVVSHHVRTVGTATQPTIGAITGTDPASYTAGVGEWGKTGSSSSARAVRTGYATRAAAGATGATAATISENVYEISVLLALKPAAGAPTPTATQFEAGAVTENSAKVVAKLATVTTSSSVRAVFATNSALSTGVVNGTIVNPTSEGRVILPVSGLAANTAYFYGIEVDGTLIASPGGRGEIATNPTPGTALSYDIVAGSCFGAESTFALGSHLAGLSPRPKKMTILGDGGYFDRFTGTVAQYRADWDTVAQIANYQTLAKTMCMEHIPSDHDYLGDNTGGVEGGYQEVSQAWRETRALRTLQEAGATDGVEQAPYQIGRVWHYLLDTRRFRSPEANTDNSSKTMLGSAQKQRLKDFCLANKYDLKILYMDCPWIGATQAGEDHWGLYQTERSELVSYFAAQGIKNIIIVAGDMHSVASDDGQNSPGNIPVFQAAPLDREGTVKGGPYQYGPEPGVQAPFQQRYGWIRITDNGGLKINVKYEGRNSSGVATITQQNLDFYVLPLETLRPTATRNVSAAFNPNTDPPAAAALAEDPDASTLTDPLTLADPSGSPTNLSNVYPNGNATASGQTGFAWATGGGVNVTDASDTTFSTEASATTTKADYFSFASGAFGAIPAGSVINSITVTIKHRAGTANRVTPFLQLGTANGSLIGSEVNATTNVAGGAGTLGTTAGGITNTVTAFGALPTLAQLQTSGAAGFGVRLRITRSNSATYDLYSIKVTVNYTPPGSTIDTKAEVLLADPVGSLQSGVGTGEIRVALNKKGSGASPSFRAEIHENASATVLATPIADTSITVSGSVTLLSGVFDESVLTNKNNAEVWLIGTGAAGGAVEFDAVEWNAGVVAGTVFSRTITDGVAIGDAASRAVAYKRTPSDAAAIADLASRIASFVRSISDPAAVADTPARTLSRIRAINDPVTVADQATKSQAHARTIQDAALVADARSRTVAFNKTISDPVALADSVAKAMGYVRSPSDPASISDQAARTVSKIRAIQDAVTVADLASRSQAHARTISDGAAISDSPARTASFVKAINDQAAVADSVSRSVLQLHARTIADSIVLADSASRLVSYIRTVNDPSSVADLASRNLVGVITRLVSDSLAISDLALRSASFQRSVSDQAQIQDAAIRTASSLRSVFDSLVVVDQVSRTATGPILRQVNDSIAIADQASRAVAFKRSILESLPVADLASGLKSGQIVRLVNDPASVADSVTVWVGFVSGVEPEVLVELLAMPEGAAEVLPVPSGSIVIMEIPDAVVEMLSGPEGEVELIEMPSGEVSYE